MSKVYVFLADGFEEIEGLTVVDLLRRAGEEVETVSIMGRKMIEGSHKIKVEADALFEETDFTEGKMLVLPGGMPGTRHLGAYKPLTDMLCDWDTKGKQLAAICAAPSVFGDLGILNGTEAVCYPGFEERLTGATIGEGTVAVTVENRRQRWYTGAEHTKRKSVGTSIKAFGCYRCSERIA